jgi:hypothetical protein
MPGKRLELEPAQAPGGFLLVVFLGFGVAVIEDVIGGS